MSKIRNVLTAALATASLSTIGMTAQAALLFEETFDYPGSAPFTLQGAAGSPWTGTTNASVVDQNLGTVASDASGPNAATVGSGSNIRANITTALETDYYFSYALRTTNAAATNAINGLHFASDGTTANASVAGISDGFFGVSSQAANNESGFVASSVEVSANTNYFIVGVIRTDDNGDRFGYNISASIFAEGDTLPTSIPVTWDAVAPERSILKAGRAPFQGIYLLTRGANTQFDDIRVSTDFTDVVPPAPTPDPIPEPASAALLALGASLIAARRRRA